MFVLLFKSKNRVQQRNNNASPSQNIDKVYDVLQTLCSQVLHRFIVDVVKQTVINHHNLHHQLPYEVSKDIATYNDLSEVWKTNEETLQ